MVAGKKLITIKEKVDGWRLRDSAPQENIFIPNFPGF